jgi:hypothetical protein
VSAHDQVDDSAALVAAVAVPQSGAVAEADGSAARSFAEPAITTPTPTLTPAKLLKYLPQKNNALNFVADVSPGIA